MRKLTLFLAVALALSAKAAQPNDSVNGRYYRLFAPLTFYHNVADKTPRFGEGYRDRPSENRFDS